MNIYIHFQYFHSIYTYLICSLNIYISLLELHFKKQFSRISFPIRGVLIFIRNCLAFHLFFKCILKILNTMDPCWKNWEHLKNMKVKRKISHISTTWKWWQYFSVFLSVFLMCHRHQIILMRILVFIFICFFIVMKWLSSFHHEVPCLLNLVRNIIYSQFLKVPLCSDFAGFVCLFGL